MEALIRSLDTKLEERNDAIGGSRKKYRRRVARSRKNTPLPEIKSGNKRNKHKIPIGAVDTAWLLANAEFNSEVYIDMRSKIDLRGPVIAQVEEEEEEEGMANGVDGNEPPIDPTLHDDCDDLYLADGEGGEF